MRLHLPAARRRFPRHQGLLPAAARPGAFRAAPRCSAQRMALLPATARLRALCDPLRCSAQRRALLLVAAWLGVLSVAPVALPAEVAVTVSSRPLVADPRPCTGRFDAQPLPHYTRGPDEFISFFESNGAGVALADLDDDGRIDVVLAGLHNPSSLIWNEGDLFFRRADLAVPLTRAVNAVDVDGDGLLDLVFTHSGGLPSWWRAEADAAGGRPGFVRMEDERFQAWFPAYAIAWADLDADGDLDLVGASYDAELGALRDGLVVGGGVFFYRNDGTGLLEFERLGRNTHALAIHLGDLDGDGRRDILIGNDFSPPDMVYLNTPEGWTEAQPFTRTPVNTMSFAEGDIDNDGRNELLATDMKPYRRDEDTDAAWGPLWAETAHLQPNDGVQVTANVLHAWPAADGSGQFIDTAETVGVDATGWSLVGAVRRPGQRRLPRPVRGERHDRRRDLLPPARRRAGGGEPGPAQHRRRTLRAGAGVGPERDPERARHELRRPGQRRRPGRGGEQPGGALAAVREPAVRRRRPGGRAAPRGRGQQPRRGRGAAPAHRRRHPAARHARQQRLPVQRPGAGPLRPRRRGCRRPGPPGGGVAGRRGVAGSGPGAGSPCCGSPARKPAPASASGSRRDRRSGSAARTPAR